MDEQLLKAAKLGDLKQVQSLLDQGADINAINNNDKSTEFYTTPYSETSLHRAVRYGHLNVVGLLIDSNANIQIGDSDNDTPLHYAAQYGHLDIAKLLIERGATQIDNKNRDIALHSAAFHGHLDIVKLLTSASPTADAEVINLCQRTPLHLAASNGHLDVVKFLIDQGSNVNNIDWYDTTPISDATDHGHYDVVKLLFEHGASASHNDTLLHQAVSNDQLDMVKLLIENGANINAIEEDYNNTPLHDAARFNQPDIMKLLLKYGADQNIRNIENQTAYDIASTMEIKKIIETHTEPWTPENHEWKTTFEEKDQILTLILLREQEGTILYTVPLELIFELFNQLV